MSVGFDSTARALMGEDALIRVREYVESDAAPDSPLRDVLKDYLRHGSQGPFVDRLVFASLCDAVLAMDARLKVLERRED